MQGSLARLASAGSWQAGSGDWQAAHDIERVWLEEAARWGAWLLAALVLAVVLKAWARSRRYRALGVLSTTDVDGLEAQIAAAEQRTTGELVAVVLERSDAHPQAHAWAALFGVFVGSLLLAGNLPWEHPAALLAAQLGLAGLAYLLSRALPDWQRMFVAERRASEVAEEQAAQEFQRLGLHATSHKGGVLIFVSLFEHRVVVLADQGLHALVGPETWVDLDGAVLAGVRSGSLHAGLGAGIQRAAEVLARHFPREEPGGGELANRIVVRRE